MEVEQVVTTQPKCVYNTLVLSGGSSKGFVTLGAIQYAYDNYMVNELNMYIGTSSGAIICYLLAIGYTPIEIMVYICTHQIMEKMQHFNIVAMIQGHGASSFNSIHEHLEKMSIAKIGYLPTLLDIKNKYNKTLVCVTYNLTTENAEYLRHETHPNLPCLVALRMSANLPLVFEHFKYNNCFYVDGGVSDNFAINIADVEGAKVLGIMLMTEQENFNSDPDMNTLEFIYKLMFIPITQAMESQVRKMSDRCNVIKLVYNKLKFFNFNVSPSEKLNMFSSGYEQMRKYCLR
jgi:predicted acylesterase/phospholipase RssA